jgi:uncharacterized membrane protein YhaH (DUF805 family)
MGVVNFLFGFNGRVGRLAYFLGVLVFALLGGLVLMALGHEAGVKDQGIVITLVETVVGFTSLASCLALGTKRCHDLNRSGWWLFAGLAALFVAVIVFFVVPVLGSIGLIGASLFHFWQTIQLLFFKGDAGANDFGTPPAVMRQLTGAETSDAAEPAWAAQALKKATAANAAPARSAAARTAATAPGTTTVTRVARAPKLVDIGVPATPIGFGRRNR